MARDGGIEFADFVIAQIQHVEHGTLREKHEAGEHLALLRRELELAQRPLGGDRLLAAQQQRLLVLERRLFFSLEVFLQALEPALDLLEVGEHQFEVQRDGVAQRVDAAGRVRHGGIVEDAQHVRQRVHFAQRREDGGIARAALGHAADVHVVDGGVGHLARLVERGELIDARLGNACDADVRGRARGFFVEVRARENSKQSGLADLRKSDDSSLHGPRMVAQRGAAARRGRSRGAKFRARACG